MTPLVLVCFARIQIQQLGRKPPIQFSAYRSTNSLWYLWCLTAFGAPHENDPVVAANIVLTNMWDSLCLQFDIYVTVTSHWKLG